MTEANGSTSRESQRTTQKIKDWLNPTDSDSPASEFRKHLHCHAQGTGEWILETDQYRDWIESKSVGNLWIRGIPGCGKSVVAANLTRRLQRLDDNEPVLFFFFREIIHTNRSPRSLLQDFCCKLLAYSPDLRSVLKQLRQDFPEVGSVPFGKLWKCLATSLQSMKKVYCVVDALDEMESGHDEWLEEFLNLGRQYPQSIKIIVTSRQVPSVEKHMGGSSLVDLRLDRRRVDRDISTFVTQRLEQTQLGLSPTEVEKITNAICERGKGLFLYSKLMLEELLRSPRDMCSRIHNLPEGLGDMYTNLLREHATRSGTSAEFQRLVLEWVTHSARPLRLLELASMIESLPDRGGLDLECNVKNAIRNTCGPLLEVCEDGVIQIIHHSLTEFILNRDVEHTRMANENREIAVVDSTAVHGMIAQTCLQYLSNGCLRKWAIEGHKPNERKALFLQFYFLRYAVTEWPFHVARAGDSNAELLQQLEQFSQDANQTGNQNYEAWNNLWRSCQGDVPKRCSILHVTAYAGLVSYAKYLLFRGLNPDTKDEDGRTPLVYAVMKGQHDMVELLLQHGASLDVKVDKSSSGQGKSLIHYACKLNRISVLQALIQGGADPMVKEISEGELKTFNLSMTSSDSPLYQYPKKMLTAFALSCQNGESEAVCELVKLVDSSCLCEGQPLHLAAKGGKHEIVSALLKHEHVRGTINDRDDDGNTPIYLAARKRNARTVQALLDHGADVNVMSLNRNFPPEPPMQDESKVKAAPSPSYTPLHAWALGIPRGQLDPVGKQDMIETLDLLLNAGCDINAQDHRGRTVLFAWPRLHWLEMRAETFVGTLLERGADATVVDNDGATPLHSTESVAYEGVIKALVNSGCDINAQRKQDGLTALMCTAMQQNHEDPALFHELKADFDRQDWLGNTALHHNFMRTPAGKDCFADTWLVHSNLRIQNHLGRTPLHAFMYRLAGKVKGMTKKDFEPLLEIINHGSSLESREGFGRTALLVALTNTTGDSLKLVEELLRLGADAQAKDYEGKSGKFSLFLSCTT
ncbi:uncharacterized protein N7477_005107 [Penicillium maclennaniae]|uniref:uncharacterized protein n=1 Tax=Penicillium maclennaniae TaxID=1343394 RepID=UPI0025405CC9|nr:uncharacterized protein N7477_005107 [Penicillium maclennaniae]KAJ5675173.1 hypothetical protein N7477_005107 [Penicillium maclennaniae]